MCVHIFPLCVVLVPTGHLTGHLTGSLTGTYSSRTSGHESLVTPLSETFRQASDKRTLGQLLLNKFGNQDQRKDVQEHITMLG